MSFPHRECEHPPSREGGTHPGRAAEAAASLRVARSLLAYSNKGGSHAIHGYSQKRPPRSGGRSHLFTLSSCWTSCSLSRNICIPRCDPPPEGLAPSLRGRFACFFSRPLTAFDSRLRFVAQENHWVPFAPPSFQQGPSRSHTAAESGRGEIGGCCGPVVKPTAAPRSFLGRWPNQRHCRRQPVFPGALFGPA